MRNRLTFGSILACLLTLSVGLSLNPATAASIRQIGTAEMLGAAEMVFHGRVLSIQYEPGTVGDSILTRVTFEIFDIVKGRYSGSTMDLTFLGGRLNGIEMKIAGMTVPRRGEEGVYFIESVSRPMINPIYGWDQGHFLVSQSPDREKGQIYTLQSKPVVDVVMQESPTTAAISKGTAVGIMTLEADSKQQAITVRQFKRKLRRMLKNQHATLSVEIPEVPQKSDKTVNPFATKNDTRSQTSTREAQQ